MLWANTVDFSTEIMLENHACLLHFVNWEYLAKAAGHSTKFAGRMVNGQRRNPFHFRMVYGGHFHFDHASLHNALYANLFCDQVDFENEF